MLELVKKILNFNNLQKSISNALELENSIKENRAKANELAEEYLPIIDKLKTHTKALDIASTLTKSEFKQVEYITLLDKHKDKLKKAEDEYYTEIGKLTKENKDLTSKLSRLMNKEEIKKGITLIKYKNGLEEAFNTISDKFEEGLVPVELFSKSLVDFSYKFNDLESTDIENIEGFEGIFKSFYEGNMSLEFFEKAVKAAQETKVGKVMKEFKEGTLKTKDGKKVTSRQQAIAIAMSEAGLSKAEVEEQIQEEEVEKAEEDELEKAKYIRREGSPGNYRYIYAEGSKGKSKKQEVKKESGIVSNYKKEGDKESFEVNEGGKTYIYSKEIEEFVDEDTGELINVERINKQLKVSDEEYNKIYEPLNKLGQEYNKLHKERKEAFSDRLVARGEVDNAKQQLNDLKRELRQLNIDMEEEIGPAPDKEKDKLANKYGGFLEAKEKEIEETKENIKKLEKEAEIEEEKYDEIDDKVWEIEEKYDNLKKKLDSKFEPQPINNKEYNKYNPKNKIKKSEENQLSRIQKWLS